MFYWLNFALQCLLWIEEEKWASVPGWALSPPLGSCPHPCPHILTPDQPQLRGQGELWLVIRPQYSFLIGAADPRLRAVLPLRRGGRVGGLGAAAGHCAAVLCGPHRIREHYNREAVSCRRVRWPYHLPEQSNPMIKVMKNATRWVYSPIIKYSPTHNVFQDLLWHVLQVPWQHNLCRASQVTAGLWYYLKNSS